LDLGWRVVVRAHTNPSFLEKLSECWQAIFFTEQSAQAGKVLLYLFYTFSGEEASDTLRW
jgi:hypothetical protein